ncbi:MAG: hypothetical protein GXO19_03215, partial [Epsilonproteobacteria bacterium]|nr:hypothetical protein [Campylobacterota bacterium]NPA56727.1 hypothetical protein [Campylobacterota bacterium]
MGNIPGTFLLSILLPASIWASGEGLILKERDTIFWEGGFCKILELHNTSPNPIEWKVEREGEGIVYSSWNATLSQDPATLEIEIEGPSGKKTIEGGERVEFGFCAERTPLTPPSRVDYRKVLPLALKFYEAQRAAGPFPTVWWRKPAALD